MTGTFFVVFRKLSATHPPWRAVFETPKYDVAFARIVSLGKIPQTEAQIVASSALTYQQTRAYRAQIAHGR